MRHFFRLAFLAAILSSIPAHATIHDGSISGTVADSNGAPVPYARVTLFVPGVARPAAADEAGRFLFTNVPPGDYPVQAEQDGFETVVREAIPVSPATETFVAFSLAPEPDQTVTLTDEAPLLDPAGRIAGTTFSEAALTGVPRWITFAALVDDVTGVVAVSTGERERFDFRSRGVQPDQTRWYLDSFDVTTSDARLSAAVASALRTSREIRMITGGSDPALASPGLNIVSVVPRRNSELSGSIFAYGSDGGLGGSSSVPRSQRDTLVQADSIDRSFEAGTGLGLPLITDRMWGWFSFGFRSVDGNESREDEADDSKFEDESRSLYVHLDSQWTPRYAASLAVFHATRDDGGREPIDGKASGVQIHESFILTPRLFVQGSGAIVTETIQPFSDGDRWIVRVDGSWTPSVLRGHELQAGLEGGQADGDPAGAGFADERFAFYAADTIRTGSISATASLRAESLETGDRRLRELLPRASFAWRPGEANLEVLAGYSRYNHQRASDVARTVSEVFLSLEREIASGLLLSSRLVERKFDDPGEDGSWRGLELDVRRRMSSGIYFDGQVSYIDSELEDSIDAHWAYSFSAIAQIPMAGISAGVSLHGRDGVPRRGEGRLSDTWALDIRMSRQFGSRRPLTLSVDIFNVTDERALLVENGFAGGFPEVQQPRAVRLGVTTAF